MSFTYGFYNSVNHDRVYDAQQWSSIFDGLIADGIYETQGDKFIVSATDPASMIVTVGTGRAWFHHTWSLNDSLLPLTLDDSDLVVPRIDVICLETNTNAEVRANAIKILKGLPAANPVAPTLTHSEFVNQYALAEILIPAGATSITQANITNKVGTSGTPFVVGVVEVMDIDAMVAQWTAQWNEYIVDHENDLDAWIADFEAELTAWKEGFESSRESAFDVWFQHMKDQLSEDAAGHLQEEIDEINEVTIPDLDKKKQNNEQWVPVILLASNWNNGTYSLENLYPSTLYDIVDILPYSATTEDMRDAWSSANCGGYEPTNTIVAHDDPPTIDLNLIMGVRYKRSDSYAPTA